MKSVVFNMKEGVPQEGSQDGGEEIGNFVGGNLVLKALCECVCVL